MRAPTALAVAHRPYEVELAPRAGVVTPSAAPGYELHLLESNTSDLTERREVS